MFVGRDESVAYCLAHPDRPPTPEKDSRYRKVKTPGERVLHFGYRGDSRRDDGVFGSVDKRDRVTATHVLDTRKPPMTAYTETRAEELLYKR